jgi:hypothetical protein
MNPAMNVMTASMPVGTMFCSMSCIMQALKASSFVGEARNYNTLIFADNISIFGVLHQHLVSDD